MKFRFGIFTACLLFFLQGSSQAQIPTQDSTQATLFTSSDSLAADSLLAAALADSLAIVDSLRADSLAAEIRRKSFVRGVDLAFLDEVEQNGGLFRQQGSPTDALGIFEQNAINYVRLHLFHTPPDSSNSLEQMLKLARRATERGMRIILDIHYSDGWTDQYKQDRPAAWQDLSFANLSDAVFFYSREVIRALKAQNTLPAIVQVGHEISNGILWDGGRVGEGFNRYQNWWRLSALLKSAIRGIKASLAPDEEIRIMIHTDYSGDALAGRNFYNKLRSHRVPFDIIGLSYYHWQHGSLTGLRNTLRHYSDRYERDIVIAETAYPWTLNGHDNVINNIALPKHVLPGYPASPEGQQLYLEELYSLIKSVPNHRGKGIIYRAPEKISTSALGSAWENVALFDTTGELLPAIRAFGLSQLSRIKMRLNAALLPDTLRAASRFSLRGAVNGLEPHTFANGQRLAWDASSNIDLFHRKGDYYEAVFYATDGDTIDFNFWSPEAKRRKLKDGWDFYDPATKRPLKTRLAVAGDTTLPMHFFSNTDSLHAYGWTPWQTREDTVAVWFRVFVNTEDGLKNNYKSGDKQLLVGVRGIEYQSADRTVHGTILPLHRESTKKSSPGYHMFSGAAYFPKSAAGSQQIYKFCIGEEGIETGNLSYNRTFVIPESDTTLHWAYFGNTLPIPWYQSQWAYLLYFATGLGLLFGLFYGLNRWYTRKLAARNKELTVMVKERTQKILDTQEQLIMQEKMASLGQMTAGIAHEIKNPLNFVNNFAEGSVELVQELQEEIAKYQQTIDDDHYENMSDLLEDIKQNVIDIHENGKRADKIVHSMMDHTRESRGERQPVDLNELLDENINLAYHGFRSQKSGFHIDINSELDAELPKAEVIPQDLGRVFLNIVSNACYALHQKYSAAGDNAYTPALQVKTLFDREQGMARISIRDNGFGIPADIREKIFEPFFTTKPTGQGNTGLGLSISYDIVVTGHQGTFEVDSDPGHFTEFRIALPIAPNTQPPAGN